MSNRVAVVVDEEYEDSELTIPCNCLREAGFQPIIVGKNAGKALAGKRGKSRIEVDMDAGRASPDDYVALVIPGGHSPDHLRTEPAVVDFVRDFCASGKLVAAVCHGPQLLIEADAVSGKTLTSWPSVKKDLENAGATWVDREVVQDGNLVTSRKPEDLGAFCAALLKELDHTRSATSARS